MDIRTVRADLEHADWRVKTATPDIHTDRAYYTSDTEELAARARWYTPGSDRQYIADPLAPAISAAYADYLFADAPTVRADTPEITDRIERIAETTDLWADLRDAAEICSAEGQVWWHVRVARDIVEVPLIEWISRREVIPHRVGRYLAGATLWRELSRAGEGEAARVVRYLETHLPGEVHLAVYRGTDKQLGDQVALSDVEDTADLPDEILHSGGLRCGVVHNAGRTDDKGEGVSDYARVRDLLSGLDEAETISQENLRLTSKNRMFVDADLLDSNPDLDADIIAIAGRESNSALGEVAASRIEVAQYRYDPQPLIADHEARERRILTRVGLVPQVLGTDSGQSGEISGLAIRLRYLPTVNAAKGRQRAWTSELNRALIAALQVDTAPLEEGGLGQPYTAPDQLSITLSSPLPVDETEQVTTVSTAVTAAVMSRLEAVRTLHPGWTEEQISEELAQIEQDQNLTFPPPAMGAGPSEPDSSVSEMGAS